MNAVIKLPFDQVIHAKRRLNRNKMRFFQSKTFACKMYWRVYHFEVEVASIFASTFLFCSLFYSIFYLGNLLIECVYHTRTPLLVSFCFECGFDWRPMAILDENKMQISAIFFLSTTFF